ncbi:MAG TPA: hypothetical protein VFV34_03055 [Blastocatellia bacterium]|nr:hypothetical protein [Blastocatellia bacterium]
MKTTTGALAVIVTAALTLGLQPRPAIAFSGTAGATSPRTATPIGEVESLGAAFVGGRSVFGKTALWDGEVVQAPNDTTARVSIDDAGVVTLSRAAVARLAKKPGPTLVMSIASGDVTVALDPEAEAYIEVHGSGFRASRGSVFRFAAGDNSPSVETSRGSVTVEQQPAPQKHYVVRPVGLGSNISVKARSTRQIQVQVTDENDRKVPDLPILFALGGKGFGSLGTGLVPRTAMTITTDARGVATVTFQAGDTAGSDTISATVEGTRDSWIGQLSVTAAGGGFWSARNSLIIAGIGAGAGVGLYFALRNNSQPITLVPPPRVTP